MQVLYNRKKYPCTCRPSSTMVYYGLPDDFPKEIKGRIDLTTNDGFILRTDYVEDYLRYEIENGVLTLTNTPKPDPSEMIEYEPVPYDPGNETVTYNALANFFQSGVNKI